MTNIQDANQAIQIDVNSQYVNFLDGTWTKVDNDVPPSLTIASDTVTWANASTKVQTSYYKTPVSYTDFNHSLLMKITSWPANNYVCIFGVWALSNGAHCLQQIIEQGGLSLYTYPDDNNGKPRLRISQYTPTANGKTSTSVLTVGTEYLLTINRTGTAITCNILGGSINETFGITGTNTTYNHLMTYHSWNNALQTAVMSGYDKDLML